MAADNDTPIPLPEPPPPRPARRDAAIAAAMRKFDGDEDVRPAAAAVGRHRPPLFSWGRLRQPQFGVLVSAALVAVIGLPAILIAIRDQPQAPATSTPTAAESVRPGSPCATPDCATATVTSTPVPGAAPPAERAVAAPPPVAMAAAAPPPPPAAPPPAAPSPRAFAEQANRDASAESIVVTGSRLGSLKSSSGTDSLDRRPAATSAGGAPGDTGQAANWVAKDRAYATFLGQLQAAVRANDRHAVVGLIGFPLRVNFASGAHLYTDAGSVGRDYDRIFTPKVRRAILAQRSSRLFGRDLGVMIGDGEIWFDHACRDAKCAAPGPVRMTAVNP